MFPWKCKKVKVLNTSEIFPERDDSLGEKMAILHPGKFIDVR